MPKRSPADSRLLAALAQAQPASHTPEAQTLAQLRAKLAQGALTAARRLAPALRGTLSYPVALLELAEAQRQAGQEDAARRTLRPAQRRSWHLYEGDSKNGYPRAYYLTLIAEAQVQLHDPASAANTLASITPQQQRQEAMQRVRLV